MFPSQQHLLPAYLIKKHVSPTTECEPFFDVFWRTHLSHVSAACVHFRYFHPNVSLDMRYPRVAIHEYTTLYAFTFTSLGDKNSWTAQLSGPFSAY